MNRIDRMKSKMKSDEVSVRLDSETIPKWRRVKQKLR